MSHDRKRKGVFLTVKYRSLYVYAKIWITYKLQIGIKQAYNPTKAYFMLLGQESVKRARLSVVLDFFVPMLGSTTSC